MIFFAGFSHQDVSSFERRCQIKIQQLFADALAPMLTRLKNMQEEQISEV